MRLKSAFFWSAIEQVGPRFVQFGTGIVLARLIEPHEFGLIGMLAVFMAAAQVFSDSGLSASLIQREKIDANDETSVFFVNICLGVFLALFLCLISPLVAGFYDQPRLIPILCAMSSTVFISSFGIVQSALLTRAMRFRHTAMIGNVGTLASGATGVGMALGGFGVWSLVGAQVARSISQVVLYWLLGSWRPIGRASLSSIRGIWSFSSNLLLSQLTGIVAMNLHSVVIGRFYSAQSLGYYDRANNLRMLPASTMTSVVGKVAFPIFSRLQADKPAFLVQLRSIIQTVIIISAGCLGLLALIANPLVPLLMGVKWLPSVPLLRVLCCASMLYPVSVLFLLALQALGKSNLNLRLELLKLANGVIVVTLVYRFGVLALAASMVYCTTAAYFMNAWYNKQLLQYRWRDQARDILPTLLLIGSSAFVSWLLCDDGEGWFSIAKMSALYMMSVCLGIWIFRKNIFTTPWSHFCWGRDRIALLVGERRAS